MPSTLEVTERFEVVRQPVAGFKTITQATEPVALKALHFTVTTYTKADRDSMDSLDNYSPQNVQCHLLTVSPLAMYIESKVRSVSRTGMQTFAIAWDVTLCEVNDNNDAAAQGAGASIVSEDESTPQNDPGNWVDF
jgi:hypothetical protein